MRTLLGLVVLLAASCGARSGLEVGPPMDAGRPDVVVPIPAVDSGPACSEEVVVGVDIEIDRTEVLFVLDRSGSMVSRLGDSGVSRDQAMRFAMQSALPMLDESADMGSVHFPGPGPPGFLPICDIARVATVPIGAGNSAAILTALEAHPINGGTPMADSLRFAYGLLADAALPSVVLVTDGGPNCHPELADTRYHATDPGSCVAAGYDMSLCFDEERTIEVVSEARANGIPTYIVGVDLRIDLFTDLLDLLADAGGRALEGSPRFHDVQQPEGLVEALETISEEIASCRFRPPIDAEGATVTVDGERTMEWRNEGRGVELTGSACVRARDGATVTFQGACPP